MGMLLVDWWVLRRAAKTAAHSADLRVVLTEPTTAAQWDSGSAGQTAAAKVDRSAVQTALW